LSTITVIHRISYTYQRTKPVLHEAAATETAPAAARTPELHPAPRA
jgi:hypothetical protein